MKKSKVLPTIIATVSIVIVFLIILISTNTDTPKEKYLKDIASHISAMDNEFEIKTNFKVKYTDATSPSIIRASRYYDSASAVMLSGITYEGTKEYNGQYITTFTASYSMSKNDYNSLCYWVDQNIVSNITATTEYEKAKAAHDYIKEHCCYGDTESISAFLKDGQGGSSKEYAVAYKIIMDGLGMDCEVIYDKGYFHNIVKVDGMWFGVNVYTDDSLDFGDKYLLFGSTDSNDKPIEGKLSPYDYNKNNPSATKFSFYLYYIILYVGWPLAAIAFIIVLINRKKL